MSVPIILILIGVLCTVVGKISLVVAAFKVSLSRGLRVLFFPISTLFFLARHWEEAKQPFFCIVVGVVLVGAGAYLGHDELSQNKEFAKLYAHFPQLLGGTASAPRQKEEKEETPEQKHDRAKAEFLRDAADLKAKYDALQLQWASIKPGDTAGRAAFDREASVYQGNEKESGD